MNELLDWFDDISKVTRVFETPVEEFTIYKGFKIGKPFNSDVYIVDGRFSNTYLDVKDKDLQQMRELGIIRAADDISYRRDKKRVEMYKRRTEKLLTKKYKAMKELPRNKALNTKRINMCKKKIDEYVDLIFYHTTRIEQYESKYKL